MSFDPTLAPPASAAGAVFFDRRELVHLGSWNGRPRSFRLPNATTPGLKTTVLVQARRQGRLLAVADPR